MLGVGGVLPHSVRHRARRTTAGKEACGWLERSEGVKPRRAEKKDLLLLLLLLLLCLNALAFVPPRKTQEQTRVYANLLVC